MYYSTTLRNQRAGHQDTRQKTLFDAARWPRVFKNSWWGDVLIIIYAHGNMCVFIFSAHMSTFLSKWREDGSLNLSSSYTHGTSGVREWELRVSVKEKNSLLSEFGWSQWSPVAVSKYDELRNVQCCHEIKVFTKIWTNLTVHRRGKNWRLIHSTIL